MSELVSETIFVERDNTFTVEYSGITFPTATKVEFILNNKTVDSVATPEFFTSTLQTDGRIIFNLGDAGYVKTDCGSATVIVYDAANTDGVIYSSPDGPTKLEVEVIA